MLLYDLIFELTHLTLASKSSCFLSSALKLFTGAVFQQEDQTHIKLH